MKIFLWLAAALLPLPFTTAVGPSLCGGKDDGAHGLAWHSLAAADKVDICHIPPDDPDNWYTISVSVNAVAAHLDHGDKEGKCSLYCNELCDDDDLCTENLCDEDGCLNHTPVDCDDEDACTVDACDLNTGDCTNSPTTKVQNIEYDDLFNQTSSCGNGNLDNLNNGNFGDFGFTFSPIATCGAITITFKIGVYCSGDLTVYLNDYPLRTLTPSSGLNHHDNCHCNPSPIPETVTVTVTGSQLDSGVNTLRVGIVDDVNDGLNPISGFSPVSGNDVYGTITYSST